MKKKPKRTSRRARGEGAVFYSDAKQCWIWRAVTGHKPGGGVAYTEGRARTQARALEMKQLAEKGNRQPGEDKETVGEHLDHWLNDVAKIGTRSNTWARYEQVVRLHLKPRVGGIPLRRLTVAAVSCLWADMIREGMSEGNAKKCSEVLASALENAVAEGKITTAPTAAATKPKVNREEVEVFTDEEVRAILKASRTVRLEALFKVAVGTGAREGELFALESTDFDPAAGTIRIERMLDQHDGKFQTQPTKSRNGLRTLRLPGFAADSLKLHARGREPGPLFTTDDGTYITRTNFVRRDWANLLAAAGVRYRKFHTLRHTHASRLLADGVNPVEVAKRIGDSIETVMRVYAHWIPTAGRDTADRVDAIYGESGERLPVTPPVLQGGVKVAAG